METAQTGPIVPPDERCMWRGTQRFLAGKLLAEGCRPCVCGFLARMRSFMSFFRWSLFASPASHRLRQDRATAPRTDKKPAIHPTCQPPNRRCRHCIPWTKSTTSHHIDHMTHKHDTKGWLHGQKMPPMQCLADTLHMHISFRQTDRQKMAIKEKPLTIDCIDTRELSFSLSPAICSRHATATKSSKRQPSFHILSASVCRIFWSSPIWLSSIPTEAAKDLN